MSKIGHWAFLIGVFLAVIAGFLPQLQTSMVSWVLILLGLVVGFLNITARETQEFLIAAVAVLVSASAAGNVVNLSYSLSVVLANVVTFVFPAALLVALKTVWHLAEA